MENAYHSQHSRIPLDEATTEAGDEHTRQITAGPQASMISLENPKALAQTISIAPTDGHRPLAITTDKIFNPDKFCFKTGVFNTERPRKLTYTTNSY